MGIAKRFITKLWNASKFALSHLQDFDKGAGAELLHAGSVEGLMPVDRWLMDRCKQTIADAQRLLNQYEIGQARHKIDEFFWKDLCDYYLEIVKERLYQLEKHGYGRRWSAQHALYYCMLNVLKLYSIYVPHITEYIYQKFFKEYEKNISLHRLNWEKDFSVDDDIILFGEKLKNVISDVRRYKTENSLSMKAEIEKVVIDADENLADLFKQTIGDIKACCCAKAVEVK